jgi:hypothetical protein
MARKKETKSNKAVAVPIEWYVPDGMITPLASNMVVQVVEDIFKVSFFGIDYPIQIDESMPPPSKIRATCIASVFITPGKMPKFIEALQKNFDKYLSKNQNE